MKDHKKETLEILELFKNSIQNDCIKIIKIDYAQEVEEIPSENFWKKFAPRLEKTITIHFINIPEKEKLPIEFLIEELTCK